MTHSTFRSERRVLAGVLLAFMGVALFAAVDIWADLREGTTLAHVAAEAGVLLVGLLGSIFMARRLVVTLRGARAAQREAVKLAEQLEVTRAEASRWRSEARELLQGLAAALDAQFDRWNLSPAEKEVALLLLKGLSHKEIADIRSVTEATARQQARSVYKKGGLSGRHDLAAFFLEDLMPPIEPGDPRRLTGSSGADV
ncbi:MAG: LuxR family transcriptional regulator [Deltaproteobacteria bacterium]|nr:MAG: LuxR family transcriptional regulator [Deltaproteobacteria bacterium]